MKEMEWFQGFRKRSLQELNIVLELRTCINNVTEKCLYLSLCPYVLFLVYYSLVTLY